MWRVQGVYLAVLLLAGAHVHRNRFYRQSLFLHYLLILAVALRWSVILRVASLIIVGWKLLIDILDRVIRRDLVRIFFDKLYVDLAQRRRLIVTGHHDVPLILLEILSQRIGGAFALWNVQTVASLVFDSVFIIFWPLLGAVVVLICFRWFKREIVISFSNVLQLCLIRTARLYDPSGVVSLLFVALEDFFRQVLVTRSNAVVVF